MSWFDQWGSTVLGYAERVFDAMERDIGPIQDAVAPACIQDYAEKIYEHDKRAGKDMTDITVNKIVHCTCEYIQRCVVDVYNELAIMEAEEAFMEENRRRNRR